MMNDDRTRYVFEQGQLIALIHMGLIDGELYEPHREVVMESPLFDPNASGADKVEAFYEEQGDFIERACNSYDDLLAALIEARDFISTIDEDVLPLTDEEEKVSNMIDGAIKKARGE